MWMKRFFLLFGMTDKATRKKSSNDENEVMFILKKGSRDVCQEMWNEVHLDFGWHQTTLDASKYLKSFQSWKGLKPRELPNGSEKFISSFVINRTKQLDLSSLFQSKTGNYTVTNNLGRPWVSRTPYIQNQVQEVWANAFCLDLSRWL